MVGGIMQDNRVLVIYDGKSGFCRAQIGLLKCLDLWGVLHFESLHSERISSEFPMISHEDLLKRMYVVSPDHFIYGGADAVKYISRKLILLWPIALLLHIPYTMPLWNMMYNFIARNRYRIVGKCTDNCKIR
jgi:predicted DCC family thiol-disulfide oxidoreductase YuxK